ncbi:MAG: hypothetical protein V2A62_05170 [Candidatus Woesearchaeota archaeon]
MEPMTVYLGMFISGLFTGLGVALANYFANRHLIKKLDQMDKVVNRLKKRKFKI